MNYQINKQPFRWQTSTVIFLFVITLLMAVALSMCLVDYYKHGILVCKDYHYEGNNKICHIPEHLIN